MKQCVQIDSLNGDVFSIFPCLNSRYLKAIHVDIILVIRSTFQINSFFYHLTIAIFLARVPCNIFIAFSFADLSCTLIQQVR